VGAMSFKPHEIEFMKAADLARLATIQPDGTLQNSPVGFSYNEALGTVDIHGYRMSKSRKFRNLRAEPNGDEIDTAIIRITPRRIISFGIDDTETEPHKLAADSRDVPTTAD
jgi:pyridoxamine 5'-phosphate oxidase family protein